MLPSEWPNSNTFLLPFFLYVSSVSFFKFCKNSPFSSAKTASFNDETSENVPASRALFAPQRQKKGLVTRVARTPLCINRFDGSQSHSCDL